MMKRITSYPCGQEIPLRLTTAAPIGDLRLALGIEAPAYVSHYTRPTA
jgi:hypothetical protein